MVAGRPSLTQNRFSTEVAGGANAQAPAAETGQASASNQDLNKRLLELKGKLAALKKP